MKRHPRPLVAYLMVNPMVQAIALAALMLAAIVAPAGSGAAARQPALDLSAPAHVAVGEAISVTFTVRDASDLAGYEAAVLFDTSAAEFAGLHQRDNDLRWMGRDVGPLTVASLPNGIAIGLYSCPVTDCASGTGPRQSRGASGNVRLATLDILPLQPGPLEIRLDAVKFVDAAGHAVQVDMPRRSLVVEVGAAGAGPLHPAPAGQWTLAGTAPAAAQAAALDVTADSRVTSADLMEAALGWTTAREQGGPCGALADPSRDVNHDGCIDVADLQMIADQAGPAHPVGLGPAAAGETILTVDSTSDADDATPGDGVCATSGGACTLRAAISESNRHAGPETIEFAIPGSGVKTIKLSKALPTLWAGGVTIDGYTQPGAQANSDPLVSNATIMIQIAGQGVAGIDAFVITSAGNRIRGLAVYDFHRPFWLYGAGAHDNAIVGDFIGTNAAADFRNTTTGQNDANGVHISQQAASNRIGTTAPEDRNVITGTGRTGVSLWFEGTDSNVIVNNLIGFTPDGTKVLGNRFHGIDMNSGVSKTIVGGTGPHERNVVNGTGHTGIEISHSANTDMNRVVGNFVGTDVTGTKTVKGGQIGWFGIQVKDRVADNVVTDNVVGSSGLGGIRIDEFGNCCVKRNRFANNRVGVSLDGTPIPNKIAGFNITAGQSMIGPANIVANNPIGILIDGDASDWNTITRNSIYGNDGLGIDLAPIGQVNPNDPGDGDNGANQQLNFPVLESATPSQVTGTACAGCTVEIFVADDGANAYGEGQTFVGSVAAKADGTFTVPINGARTGDFVTATATSSSGNTSEFSLNIQVAQGQAPGTTPSISAISPGAASAGGVDFTLSVTGANFGPDSLVRWNGQQRATTFVNSTKLTAQIAAADIAAPGTAAVTVRNGTSGQTSNALSFAITSSSPPPVINRLSPATARAGGPAFILTVDGANFSASAVVRWNGTARPTTFASAARLTAAIPADDIANAGTATVTVLDDATKRESAGASFVIASVAPPPLITKLSPGAASAGGPAFTLTVEGANFTADSVVTWNGGERPTTFISDTRLQVAIGAHDIAAAGSASVIVSQADTGAASNSVAFAVNAPAPPDTRLRRYVPIAVR